jgi:tetratricopeptide (TPR) repeat protein
VARYRAGDWQPAIEALKKSTKLSHHRQPTSWLFLAMAHWELGKKEEARRWYDQAITWIEQNQSKDEELCRFRTEAGKLMGATENNDE